MQTSSELTGQVALVTGASSGIGAATAVALARAGAAVAIGFHGNESGAHDVERQIVAAGGRAVTIRGDVRLVRDCQRIVQETASRLGPVDILVNNAGSLVERLPLADITEAVWDDIQNLNLKSAVFCTQAAVGSMIARRHGAIVNIVSIAAHNGGGPGAMAYAVAKAGLVTLTRANARELAPYGIRVNAVAPGVIATPFHDRYSSKEMMETFVKQIPLGRTGTPDECAAAVVFLASPNASFILGETIEVNGGQLMR